MSSGPHLRTITPPATLATEQPRQPLRLKLKPKAPTTGYVDGAWWPRSRDLSAELPALLAVLAVRLGHVRRVSFNLTDWATTPRRIAVDGQPVRLGGFHSQHTHTLDVIGPNEPRITLLVIPPETEQPTAHQVLMRASGRGNTDNVDELLGPVDPTEPVPEIPDLAEARWEGDGGRADEPGRAPRIPRQR